MKEISDIVFRGKLIVETSKSEELLKDFDELLKKYDAEFHGEIHSFEFTNCEIVEESGKDEAVSN